MKERLSRLRPAILEGVANSKSRSRVRLWAFSNWVVSAA
jgi:hypothetical protein